MQTTDFIFSVKNWSQAGVLGVNFFFVLSGFLITYLLLTEEKENGSFSILKFYLRRVIRIWPLYFGIVLFSFCVVPLIFHFSGKIFFENCPPFYFLTFTLNFAIIRGLDPFSPLLAMLWSIAIEEQFYAVWPLVMKWFRKNISVVFLLLILISIAARIFFIHDQKEIYFNTLCILSDFAIGGFAAYSANKNFPWWKKFISLPKIFSLSAYSLIFLVLFFYQKIFTGEIMIAAERIILGLLFVYIIAEQCFSEARIFNAGKFSFISYLGKISYGLYCFHSLGIILAKDLLLKIDFLFLPYQYMIVFPVLALAITILISVVSYEWFEKFFLRKKENISMSLS